MTRFPGKARRKDNRYSTADDDGANGGGHDDDEINCEDSGVSGSDGEENCLIKRNPGSPAAAGIHRVSSNCHRPTVSCPTCKGKGKLSQGKKLRNNTMHFGALSIRQHIIKSGPIIGASKAMKPCENQLKAVIRNEIKPKP